MDKHLINHNSSIPMYKQVVQILSNQISSGELSVGNKIPSETELMAKFGVSRITIRAAISELVEEGILTRSQGKGTFVSAPKTIYDANDVIGFSRSCQLAGKQASTKVINIEMTYPTEKQIEFFHINSDEMLICSKRLRFVDQQPTLIEVNHYHPKFSSLMNENLEGSLFELFYNKLGIEIVNGKRTLEICYSTKEEIELLKLKKKMPLLLFKDEQYDKLGNPIYLSKQLYNTENLKFYF